MCGFICGQADIKESNIWTSIQKIKHRGPDNQNIIHLNNVFLAHARLSIVDLSGGQQPLVNEDETIFACVNGEFYEYEALRNQLIEEGHTFKTKSDSEILIHLYEKHGVECLQFLHGEFAFVLYDKNRQRWFCARDRMGIRPLNYYYQKNKFFVASEAKAIFDLGVSRKLNSDNLWLSLVTLFC